MPIISDDVPCDEGEAVIESGAVALFPMLAPERQEFPVPPLKSRLNPVQENVMPLAPAEAIATSAPWAGVVKSNVITFVPESVTTWIGVKLEALTMLQTPILMAVEKGTDASLTVTVPLAPVGTAAIKRELVVPEDNETSPSRVALTPPMVIASVEVVPPPNGISLTATIIPRDASAAPKLTLVNEVDELDPVSVFAVESVLVIATLARPMMATGT